MKVNILIVFTLLTHFCFAQKEAVLNTFSKTQLLDDYTLLINALKEAHPGLYWYTNYADYEKLIGEKREEIKEGMNSYEFFRIVSRIVSADKEGHSSVYSSNDIGDFVKEKAYYLPIAIKTISNKLYLQNNIESYQTKGRILTHINGNPIDSILHVIFAHTSHHSDGFSVTGKYKDLDRFGFSSYYLDFIDFASEKAVLTLQNPDSSKDKMMLEINLVNREGLVALSRSVPKISRKNDDKIYNLEFRKESATAILTFNTFSYSAFEKQNLDFKKVVDSTFVCIKSNKTKNLIIDIRNNGGGSEGAEDYLFSYLTNKPYQKYQYVEAKGFTFSFLDYTDYKDDRENLESMLKEEHELAKDGRFLRKPEVLPTAPPQDQPFEGNVYILCSGNTYSAGSEFAAIAKAYSDAILIGEETGGGFYGQTSGSYVYLLLPNTKIEVRIPLLKFFTTFTNDNIPFGRGVIPDYHIQPNYKEYINGIDSEMNFVLKLISGNQ
ncbi:S41 family peptidase [Chondrinema litorale]|uniref:S41 family peptidase n=1 Tax=Chondrinema litorale TaxID=2994555 RepID=UPI002543D671|nr:S41 family peptidase [Chondrinema litorale]UZR94416.1 S41 family peptidase [Chondrinema litorale]